MYKILIVEDDGIIANSVMKYLQNWGYEVELVEDFNGIIDQFVRFSPQLILMDIALPLFNGYHWCTEISCPRFRSSLFHPPATT